MISLKRYRLLLDAPSRFPEIQGLIHALLALRYKARIIPTIDWPDIIADATQNPMSKGIEQTAEEAFIKLLTNAADDRFEDGKLSSLSRSVPAYIKEFDIAGVAAVRRLSETGTIDTNALAETLLTFGRLDSPATVDARLEMLTASLKHSLPSIRDAVALSLVSLRDRRAIPALKSAIDEESIRILTQSFQQALEELDA